MMLACMCYFSLSCTYFAFSRPPPLLMPRVTRAHDHPYTSLHVLRSYNENGDVVIEPAEGVAGRVTVTGRLLVGTSALDIDQRLRAVEAACASHGALPPLEGGSQAPVCATCDANAVCMDARGFNGAVCVCAAGYRGPGTVCTPVNHCLEGSHNWWAHTHTHTHTYLHTYVHTYIHTHNTYTHTHTLTHAHTHTYIFVFHCHLAWVVRRLH